MKSFFRLLPLGMALLSLQGQGKLIDFDYSESGISFTYDLSDMTTNVTGDTVTFSLPGFGDVIGDGLPTLPRRMEKFEIPTGMRLGDVIITETVDTVYGVYKSAQPLRWEENGEKCETNTEMPTGVWPANTVNVLSTGIYRDRQVGKYIVMPVRYDYDKHCFLISTQLHFEIPFTQGTMKMMAHESSSERHNISRNVYLHNLTIPVFEDQDEIMPLSPIYKPPFDAESILIVTPTSLASEAHRLAKWKQRMGYSVTVYESKYDSELQSYSKTLSIIKEEYQKDKNLEYVILFGSGYLIRPKKWTGYRSPYTDYYFGCMDGDDDEEADLCVGRIPAHNIEDAQTIVDKIINYEKNPPHEDDIVLSAAKFYKTGLHIAEWNSGTAQDDRNFIWTSEKMATGVRSAKYTVKRVYYAPPGVTPKRYPDGSNMPTALQYPVYKWNGTASDIVQNINNGASYIFCRGHGGTGAWTHMWFDNQEVAKLNNKDRLPFVFSINCLSGQIYNTGVSNDVYSLCEDLLFHKSGGAIAVIGAQDQSITELNDFLSAGLFEALVPDTFTDFYIPKSDPIILWGTFSLDPTYEMGRILEIGRDIMQSQIYGNTNYRDGNNNAVFVDGYAKYNRNIYHCLGDPTLKVYIDKPIIKDITDIMNGRVTNDRRRIIQAYASTTKDNKTYYSTAFQKDLNLWGPVLCVPGKNNISVVADGYVPVLLEDVQEDGSSSELPSIQSVSEIAGAYHIDIDRWENADTLVIFDVFGNRLASEIVTGETVDIVKPSTISIVTLMKDGAVVDSRIVK